LNTSFITLLSASEPGKIIGFGIDLPWDLMLQWLSLFVIIWILYKLLFKPVTDFLDKRKEGIAKTIEEAKGQKTSALELKADYETKLTQIKEEANQILKDARAKALVREEEIIKAAKEEAEMIKQKALNDIKLEQERVKDDMKKEMIELSTMMASKFVGVSIDETKHHDLIDETIREMGAMQWLS
jgi:F-type H+-transporting ATPase subunit b